MQPHVKTFLDFWGLTIADYIPCWKCSRKAVDVAHIMPKGMGGRNSAEFVENYIPLCRTCHELTEGNTMMMGLLWGILVKKIQTEKPNHSWSKEFMNTWYYKSELKT